MAKRVRPLIFYIMEFGGSYRKRLASGPFRNERDEEMYKVPRESWKAYKAAHSEQFRCYYARTLEDDLAQEKYRKTLRVDGKEFQFIQWRGSVCDLAVDAVINAANESLLGGGGVDGAIHDGAGYLITRECADCYDELETGGAVITKGYKLPAHFVIHAVGPVYYREQGRAAEKLGLCYSRSFQLCEDYKLETLGLCCISCGIYGYPPERAGDVAIGEAIKWVRSGKSYPKVFVYVTFTERETAAYRSAFKELLLSMPGEVSRTEEVKREEEKKEEEEPPLLDRAVSALVPPTSTLRQSQVMEVDSEPSVPPTVNIDEKSEPMAIVDHPQSKVVIEKAWNEIAIADWRQYKETHAEDFRVREAIKLPEAARSHTVMFHDTEFTLYVAQVDLSMLEVSAIITVPRITLFNEAGEFLQSDYEKESSGVCVFKGYKLPCDFLIVSKNTEDMTMLTETVLVERYRTCLKACESLGVSTVAISALAKGDAMDAQIAMREVQEWLSRSEAAPKTIIFAALNDEHAEALKVELDHAFQ